MKVRAALALALLTGLAGCWLVASLDSSDAGIDASTDSPGGDAPPGTYHALGDLSRWSVFDLQTVASPGHYQRCGFDGRFLYFAPSDYTIAAQYDTTQSFTDTAAWKTYDTGQKPFSALVFDGRFLYELGSTTRPQLKFDTTMDFTQSQSWQSVVLVDGGAPAAGFAGATFDGRYVLSFTSGDGGQYSARFDTQADFADAGSWAFVPLPSVDASFVGGTTFDGQYTYNVAGATVRYDTHQAIDQSAAYAVFPIINALGTATIGLRGEAFDGRFVYYSPRTYSLFARYDTTHSFTSASSWETYDLNEIEAGISSYAPIFDGRYVYMPDGSNSRVTRYDTTAPFDASASYEIFDANALFDGAAFVFSGAGFDGRYVYFPSSSSSIVFRFDAREPPAMPSSYHGSFH